MTEGKKPKETFRMGGLSLTIWENEGEKGSYYTFNLQRSYKDKEDKWQNTGSLRPNDLHGAIILMNKGYEFTKTQSTNK